MHLCSQWIQQNAYGGNCTKKSWRPYCMEKEWFATSLQFGAHIYSYASNQKIPAAKAAVENRKNWENSSVESDKGQKQIWGDRWSKERVKNGAFCLTIGHLSFDECRIGDEKPEVQGSSCAPRRHCERRFGLLCSIHRARIVCVTNDCRKSSRYHFKITWMRRTSSWCSICLHPQIVVPGHLDSSTTTQVAEILVQYGRPSRSSWAKSVWSSFSRTVVGTAMRENSIGARLGESSKLRMLICASWKRIILVCKCGWHKIGWKETKIDPKWKVLHKQVELGEPTSFFDHFLGMHSKTMRNTQRHCGQSQNHVRIQSFRRRNGKTTKLGKLNISTWSHDTEGHANKCAERCCELASKTTQQLYKVSTPCLDDRQFKEEGWKSVGELSNVGSQVVL